jgi:arylsulfatase A-like enzyme
MPRPNFVFVFSDQQHWQACGLEDPFFQTPNLDRFADEGVVFSQSFCTTPQCSPSRSSILTGLYPSKTGVLNNLGNPGGPPLRLPTVGAMLRSGGYHTAYFGKWHLGKDPAGTAGWDEDFGVTGKATTDDEAVTRRALEFLARRRADEPFALFVSYNDPHGVYRFGMRDSQASPACKSSS